MLTGSLDDLTLAVDEDATDELRAERARPHADVGYRVGVDVGGTFTDLICVTPDGEVVLDKTPTTLDDQSIGVMNGLGAARRALRPRRSPEFCAQLDILVHGTTTADNTMIEMNGAATGLLVDRGPPRRDRDAPGPQGGDLGPDVPGAAADRAPPGPHPDPRAHATIEGEVLLPLDEEAVRRGVRRLRQLGVDVDRGHVPVLVREPRSTSGAPREIIREEFPDVEHISLSHEVMARGPEFERVSTTLVNAYVAPRIAHYVDHLPGEAARRRLRGPAADHAVDRRRDAARLRRPARGHAARVRARPAA